MKFKNSKTTGCKSQLWVKLNFAFFQRDPTQMTTIANIEQKMRKGMFFPRITVWKNMRETCYFPGLGNVFKMANSIQLAVKVP